ncbi:hypothetical protein [Nonomuraea basaltis]|uniref:hypothetical protein n=1 Tax=Nonomuraea basaltis TaxID=2495887 RepID=UPI00110C5E19|nr:hypothetical protein [Nonomuraea basaltis]TMS00212.1 hypothetical protein EJK15_03815 [Nonomuraea basaltis]
MQRFLILLACWVFAIGGLIACVWLSTASVPAAFAAMAVYAALAIGAIVLFVRNANRPERARRAHPDREGVRDS